MNSKRLFCLFLCFFAAALVCGQTRVVTKFADIDFEQCLGKRCEFFENVSADTFLEPKLENPYAPAFQWTSDKKTEARFPAYRNSPKIRLWGLNVCEMIVRFNRKKPCSVYLMFYNRGDMRELGKSEFQALLSRIQTKAAEFTKDKGMEREEKLSSENRVYQTLYFCKNTVFELKWSTKKQSRGMTCEYIQMEIYPFDTKNDPRKKTIVKSAPAQSVKGALANNVIRENKGNGAVWIDNIPMVDQGQKGYCVPAVMERLLRYYGNQDATQHVFAQISNSGAAAGTDINAMFEQVKRIGLKFGIRANMLYLRVESVKDLETIIKKYNDTARKMRRPGISAVIENNCYMMAETLAQMQPDVELKMWTAQKGEIRKFQKQIHEYVNQGIPLMWGVTLGNFREEMLPVQINGGHMRLIIGYDDAQGTIFYSDTWGKGHEKKSMPLDQAWTITQALIAITPRK